MMFLAGIVIIGLLLVAAERSRRRERDRIAARELRSRMNRWQERKAAWQQTTERNRDALRLELKGLPFSQRRRIVESAFDKGLI